MSRASSSLVIACALFAGACATDDDDTTSASASTSASTSTTATPATTTTAPAPTTTAPDPVDSPLDVDTPATVADAVSAFTRTEQGLRTDPLTPEEARALSWEQQIAYRELATHPEWLPDVLAQLPPDVRPIVEANHTAGQLLTELAEPQPTLPDWRILVPAPPEELMGYYREVEAASGIPWPYLAAIHFVESRTGRIRGLSVAGAQGPMQFIPETWANFGQGDVYDNRDAILAAGRYLDSSGGPEDMRRALFAYNNHDSYVAAIEIYAGHILADERAYRGYYHWQVYYATTAGSHLLPEGYPDVPAEVTSSGGLATMALPR